MRPAVVALAVFLMLAGLAPVSHARCDSNGERPSVGLALSGGGARGAAHVGVIRVLEEMRVPIDCIAGTSMGAVIGGLYAGGYDAEQLVQISQNVDWADAFRDDPPRRHLSFRRKQDDYDFLADFELGLRDGAVRFPLGLVQGQKLNLLLRALNLPLRAYADFDALPTPFRAVATDAANGSSVVLGRGDLAKVLRASMAAPGVFAPIEIDGRLLIDGGVTNNLPVNVVRAMGADIVIAVDISFPLVGVEELDSAIAMTNQALTILMRHETHRQLGSLTPRDVAIVPDLGQSGSADFEHLDLLIVKGQESAQAQSNALARLALDEAGYAAFMQRRHAQRAPDRPRLASITIEDDSRLSRAVVAARMRSRIGEPVDVATIERDIARIYGMNIFETVDYTFTGSDEIDLRIRARQKSWGPNFLSFGLNLIDDFEGSSSYNLGMRYTRTQVNPLGAEWRFDFQVGDNPALGTEFYQPVGYASRFFVAPQIRVQKFDADFFSDIGELLAQYRVTEKRYGVDLGYLVNDRMELRAGLAYETGRAVRRIGDPALGSFDSDGGKLRFLARYDNLDSTSFPRAGALGTVSWEAIRATLGADNNRDRIIVDWLGVRTFGETSVLTQLALGSNLGSGGGVEDLFELGGLFNLSGYRTGQLRGQHRALTTVSLYQRVKLGTDLRLPVYFGGSLEAGNVWNSTADARFSNLRYGASLFLGMDTPIGPVYLAYGFAEGGNSAAYFFLGRSFGPRN